MGDESDRQLIVRVLRKISDIAPFETYADISSTTLANHKLDVIHAQLVEHAITTNGNPRDVVQAVFAAFRLKPVKNDVQHRGGLRHPKQTS